MDDTPAPSTADSHPAAASALPGESEPGAEAPGSEASPLAAPRALNPPDGDERTQRAAAGTGVAANAAMLIAIVAALIGVLGTGVGIPLYLLDSNVRDLSADVGALADDVKNLENEFAKFEGRVDARFAEQDAKFEARIASRFAEQDAKFDARFTALEKGQAEIDRKLTALIAHLNTTEAVEAALEGRIE